MAKPEALQDAADLAEEPRRNLGNIPDDIDPTPQVLAPEDEEAPEEDVEGEEATVRDDAEAAAGERDQASERLQALEREIQFLRGGMQPQAPAQPQVPHYDANNILPIAVTGRDLEQLGLPADSADTVNNLLRVVALSAKEAAKQELRGEYNQAVGQHNRAEQLRTKFYGDNADLAPYAQVVGQVAAQAKQQYPQADESLLLPLIADESRKLLRSWNVPLGDKKAKASRTRRTKAPQTLSTGGGGSAGNGRTRLTPRERDIMSLIQ